MGRRVITVILIALAVAGLAVGVGGAYHAGFDNGVSSGGHITRVVQAGRYWYPGYGPGYGFFPGFFLFPVVVLLIVGLVVWRRPWHHHWWHGHGPGGPGGWSPGGPPQAFEEWHRQAHAADQHTTPGAPPPPDASPG